MLGWKHDGAHTGYPGGAVRNRQIVRVANVERADVASPASQGDPLRAAMGLLLSSPGRCGRLVRMHNALPALGAMRAIAIWLAGGQSTAAERKDALVRVMVAVSIDEIELPGHMEGP